MSAPIQLTHCCDCGKPFPEPADDYWQEYWDTIEDVKFACEECSEREGYPSEFTPDPLATSTTSLSEASKNPPPGSSGDTE